MAAPAAAPDLEEQKKVLLPILQRASEIEAMEPRVAYYCRLYAIKRALEIEHPAKEIQGLIKALFDQCERDKGTVAPAEGSDRLYCENFALTVFSRADRMDRAGRADINTAKCYYAAAIFLQVLEQFLGKGEEMDVAYPDVVEKARYALWRAAELRKAQREGRPPAPPPEPAEAAAAVAAAAGSSGGGDGGLFAGPAYDASAAGAYSSSGGGAPHQQPQQHAPPAGDPLAVGGVTASTDDLLALPHPPSTTPPAGTVGLLEPAAAAGPRFRLGSLVWAAAPADDGPPAKGTVGQLVGADKGQGGQALYKVALSQDIQEFVDSQLAPMVGAGDRVVYIAALGERPEAASVIAAQTDQWPVTYLLQLDSGRNLAATGGHLRLDAGAAPVVATPPASAGGSYPSAGGAGYSLPAAPPLVDPHPPPAPPAAPSPYSQQQQQQQPAPYPQPPAAGHAGPHSSSTAAAARAPPPPAAARHPPPAGGSGSGWTPAAAAALDAAVASAQAGGFRPSAAAVAEAQKLAKWTKSSLDHDDVAGAVKCLADALKALMGGG